MLSQFKLQMANCNEVVIRDKNEVVNTNTITETAESFMQSDVMNKNEQYLLNLIYNHLERTRVGSGDTTQGIKPKNLTAATECHELKNTTSDSETFLGRFKQQNNEVSQQINLTSGGYHVSCRQLDGTRHQEVSRYRIQERQQWNFFFI